MRAAADTANDDDRASAWLSRGLETLVGERPWMAGAGVTRTPDADPDFDVVIVGSGYGGAVAAAELAGSLGADGKALTVCVLERGKEYLAGMFPSRLADLAGHARFATPEAKGPRGVRDGLFDMRWSDDACAIVANGLGGGSLINAGVMAMPVDDVFREARWPQAIREDASLHHLGKLLRARLGASLIGDVASKTAVLRLLAGAHKFEPLPVTMAARTGQNSAGVTLDKCIGCGDCATGCNHNAKDSLDLNLLRTAASAGARLYTGVTVLRLKRRTGSGACWELTLNHTDGQLRGRQPVPFLLRAKRVVLAAGTLGSTEILMRSQGVDLRFSAQLGHKFSANGDMIATAHALNRSVNAVADETVDPLDPNNPVGRGIGPTITAMIDRRTGNPQTDLVIQDLAVPAPLRRLFEELMTTADVLRRLAEGDAEAHTGERDRPDDAAVDKKAMQRSLVVAMIGRDDADGELRLADRPVCDDADGLLTVHWPGLRSDDRFGEHHERLSEALAASKLGGRLIDNPLWRPLSNQLENVFGRQRGPMLTVHPLGGCGMGEDVRSGVTDHLGRVFDAAARSPMEFHPGLVVLDGSIVPTSLGINPALTIAVLAMRAITALKTEWKIGAVQPAATASVAAGVRRPRFATPVTISTPQATWVELTEQMRGEVQLRLADGSVASRWVEITLTSQPAELAGLMKRDEVTAEGRTLEVCADKGRLRILKRPPDAVSDKSEPADVELVASIQGTLRLFALEASHPTCRAVHASWAWLRNRGLRDVAQSLIARAQRALSILPAAEQAPQAWLDYARDIWRLSSRAGGVRLLEYDLTVVAVLPHGLEPKASAAVWDAAGFPGQCIRGVKRMTYARGSSPWAQLMELELEKFPHLASSGKPPPRLELNPRYLARQVVPLLRVVGQQDRVAALVDLLSFALFVGRMVLQTHALSFRRPDAPAKRRIQRLPGHVPGLPPPQIEWLAVGTADQNPALRIRLARYHDRAKAMALGTAAAPPVLLIHGYSASGTTFAHKAVPGNLAQTLCEAGRDVWVLDMRSSAGMPSARENWAFEDMALHDIPVAIDHVLACTDSTPRKVDVVAHCMGSAMFAMAVLALNDREGIHNLLNTKIGRLVMSQVGPAVVLSPANVLRAYVMRYVRHFLPLEDYIFSPEGEVSLAGQLLDRALATLPVPLAEYKLENPLWPPGKSTPWVGTRHRMDALYARTFALGNMSDEVLECIDDFFGPLSVETVSQVIHFARYKSVTERNGFNRFVVPARIQKRLTFPMLSIHGELNGLADVATLAHMRKTLQDGGVPCLDAAPDGGESSTAQPPGQMHARIEQSQAQLVAGKASYMTWRIAGHGHQDCLIGKDAGEVSSVIAAFLARQQPEDTGS